LYFIKVYSVMDTLMHSFCGVLSESVGVSSHVSHMRKKSYIIAGCMDFLCIDNSGAVEPHSCPTV
jgi:hypothetical protein